MLAFFTIEKPKTCIECKLCLCDRDTDKCLLTGKSTTEAIDLDIVACFCPLRKVPSLRSPHTNYQSAKDYYKGFNDAMEYVINGKRRKRRHKKAEGKDKNEK